MCLCVFDDGEGRKGRVRVCEKGGRWRPFSLGPRTSQSTLTQDTGSEGWVKTENCRLQVSEH